MRHDGGVEHDRYYTCSECGSASHLPTCSKAVPAIPDSSDRTIAPSRNAKNLHGWTVERWIQAIKENPERTLPNGVGGAIVAYYETRFERAPWPCLQCGCSNWHSNTTCALCAEPKPPAL